MTTGWFTLKDDALPFTNRYANQEENDMSEAPAGGNNQSARRRFLAKALGILAGTSLLGGILKSTAKAATNPLASTGGGAKQVDFANPALGQIIMFAGNFAPTGWAFCDGQLLPISQYTALFSLLGTTYGGDGRVTFALPDLRGRAPIGFGQGPGLNNYILGQVGGEETHTLATPEMPAHSHAVNVDSANGTSDTPVNNVPAVNSEGIQHYGSALNGTMSPGAIGSSGGGLAHNNMQPYLGINFLIALSGIFPSHS